MALATAVLVLGIGLGGALGAGETPAGDFRASASATYSDPGGDGADGPDITTVRVVDEPGDVIAFRIEAPNRSALEGSERVSVYLDSVQGKSNYEWSLSAYGGGRPSQLLKWNAARGLYTVQRQLPDSSFVSGVATLKVRRAEVNIGGPVYFLVRAWRSTNEARDRAPNQSVWSFPPRATTTTTAVTTASDPDHDGVPTSRDQCPATKAGRFDYNGNGCPGPFKRIEPTLPRPSHTSNNLTTFRTAVFGNLPPAATVTVRRGASRETLRASAGGTASSRLITRAPFRDRASISIQIVKTGWIGYAARFQVLTRPPFTRVLDRQCIPPLGPTSPRACRSVAAGK